MLGVIRERMQGWIAWAIVILLIIPFAFWGIQEYFGTGGPQIVALVNGEKIHQRDYNQAVSEQRQFQQQRINQMRQMFGDQFSQSVSEEEIKKAAIDQLVNQEVLLQHAADSGLRVSKFMVFNRIQGFEDFQEDGKFSAEMYKNIMARNDEGAFVERIRRNMLTQQIPSTLSNSLFVTQFDVDRILKLQEQKRDIEFLILKAPTYRKESDATQEAMQEYFEKHKDSFKNPEKVIVEYVELSGANLQGLAEVQPTEENLQEYYKQRSSQFTVPPERRTSHILISVDDAADEAKVKAAKAKADDLHKQIKAGADFTKLAKEHSEDPGSSKLGGDIGFFGTGSLDPSYEKTMFALKKGEISEPVLSSFGYHIIKVTEIRETKTKTFEDVRAELEKEFKDNAVNKKYFELSDKLTTLAYEVNDTLTDAAAEAGLKIQTSPVFSRQGIPGDKLFSNAKLLQAAFTEDVLGQGYNSDPIELGENHVVVLRIKEHIPSSSRTLEESKADVKQRLLTDKAKQHAAKKGAELLSRLRSGESMEKLAKELKLEITKQEGIKRTERNIDQTIVKRAFKLPKPAAETSVYDQVVLNNGDYVLMALRKVSEADPATLDKNNRDSTKNNLVRLYGSSDFDMNLEAIKKRAAIIIKDDQL